jgi:integral membrane protein
MVGRAVGRLGCAAGGPENAYMTTTTIGRLRLIGYVEAVSFLILLGVAMPLKYAFDRPEAVKIVGWVHGVLFIVFVLALAAAARRHQWNLRKSAAVFIAALLPFGPFIIDSRLKREGAATVAPGTAE